jgi:HPt (histidine-containing phosphotransfer) domain-containing protein
MDDRKDDKMIIKIDPDLADLIPEYLLNRRKDIESITSALASGDFESIRITGHSLKGSGGGYGFPGLTDIGKEIEISASEKNGENISKWVRELASYMDRVEVVY